MKDEDVKSWKRSLLRQPIQKRREEVCIQPPSTEWAINILLRDGTSGLPEWETKVLLRSENKKKLYTYE